MQKRYVFLKFCVILIMLLLDFGSKNELDQIK